MELESQKKCEWLCSRKPLTSQFEATLDGLKGDGQSIINEFVDWESAGPTFSFNELRDALCGEAKYLFDANHMYLFGLAYTGRDSKKIWTSRTIELNGIESQKHPDNLEALLNIDINSTPFYFQQALNIDAINNETKCIDRKAHLFWEIPVIDAKINDLMTKLSYSGKAAAKLVLNGDNKDSRKFFIIKKKEEEKGIKQELGFIDSLFMMFKLREKIARIRNEIKAYNFVKQYSHNFGDFIFYKCMNFRSSYLEGLAKTKNHTLNAEARIKASEYFLETLLLQYNTLLFNCEKTYMELINYTLFVDFIIPLFDKKLLINI